MKNKVLSIMLSGILMTAIPTQINAIAIEESHASALSADAVDSVEAAGLIASYAISCTSGTKSVYISAEVSGNKQLAKIGFKNIKVQRSSDKSSWTTEKTVSDQIAEDARYKFLTSYQVSVSGGYYYRVVLDNYAKEDTWWFPDTQTVQSISNSVWVP